MIILREINKHNWETCIQLQVEPGQEAFITSNLYSIAQAQFLDGFVTRGIYKEDQMIGFAMFGLDFKMVIIGFTDSCWIATFKDKAMVNEPCNMLLKILEAERIKQMSFCWDITLTIPKPGPCTPSSDSKKKESPHGANKLQGTASLLNFK
ncbi:hypothetical protein [Paenibacillus roseus]|uniref:hypothetical protein n=1 Tax=Paenibacillus roseus TaxID=2798579 RepID=UPI003F6998E3